MALGGQAFPVTSVEPPLCLDLGCGPGTITISLAEIGYEAIGVDSSPAMIDLACAAVAETPAVKGRCTFECEDLTDFLERFPGQADFILSSSVFEYLRDPQTVLELVSARLKTGGSFAVSVPNRRSLYRRIEPLLQLRKPKEMRYRSHWGNNMRISDLVRTAEAFGLSRTQMTYFGLFRLNERALFSWFTDHSLVGTLTLIAFAKR